MDNVVEKLTKGQASTGQAQNSPEADSGDAKESSRYSQRVHQLANENATLRQRLEALEQQTQERSVPEGERPSPRGWGDFSEAQLEKVAVDPEVSEQTRYQAMRELNERRMKSVAEEYYKKGLKDVNDSTYRERVIAGLVDTFGEDVSNTDSELWQGANAVYSHLESRYGKDALERLPELTELCFLKAHHELSKKDKDELNRLRELERRVLSSGGLNMQGRPLAPSSSDGVRDALRNKDVKGATKALADKLLSQE